MATIAKESPSVALDLPREFEGLEGLIQADLQAVVAMIAQRAHDRLWLTRREHTRLQARIWNGLAEVVNEAVTPLSLDNR